MMSAVGMVGDVVAGAEEPIQVDEADRAKEGKKGDSRADPEGPCEGAKVVCDNVGSGLTDELAEI